jgi:hypothetical protein
LGTCRDLPPADQVCIERRCTLVSWHTDNQHSRQHPATGAVGKDAKMPSYIVLVSSLGGIATFGVNGVVIGPLMAALFLAAWGMHFEAREEAQQVAGSG